MLKSLHCLEADIRPEGTMPETKKCHDVYGQKRRLFQRLLVGEFSGDHTWRSFVGCVIWRPRLNKGVAWSGGHFMPFLGPIGLPK